MRVGDFNKVLLIVLISYGGYKLKGRLTCVSPYLGRLGDIFIALHNVFISCIISHITFKLYWSHLIQIFSDVRLP